MAMGNVQEFSWGAVAASALTAGITAGAGSALGATGGIAGKLFTTGGSIPNILLNGAINNVIGQRVNILMGQQEKFSWKSVAAGAVAGVVSAKLSIPKLPGYEYAANLGNQLIGGSVRQVMEHGKIDWRSLATDSFGNVIGNGIVTEIQIWNMPQHIQDLDLNQMNRDEQGKDKELDYAHKAYAHIMRSGASAALAEQFAKDVSSVGYKYQEWMKNYEDIPQEERDARATGQLDRKWQDEFAFLTDGPGHTGNQELVMGPKWGPTGPMDSPQYFQQVVDFLQGNTETYIHSMKSGEESPDSARSKINYVFRQAMNEAFTSGHQADDRSARLYETMALHIYQDATAEGHRYDDSRDRDNSSRPWPMGSDNNMPKHIESDSIHPGPLSNNMLATRYVDMWFERGYVPDGDILTRIGVDTSSDTQATKERWEQFNQMNIQLQDRPSYEVYKPVSIREGVPADMA